MAGFDIKNSIQRWGVTPLDSGRIAFLDHREGRVIVVDTIGRMLTTLGRKGSGPGELTNAQFLMLTDSGLAVYDGRKFALVRFDRGGRPLSEVPQLTTIGMLRGVPTGMTILADGSWVYAIKEGSGPHYREALYMWSNGQARLLASTSEAVMRVLRLPCGIAIGGGGPVFWPTLRWTATRTHVAYAVSADDRVVVWSVASRDSLIVAGEATPRRATKEAALAITDGLTVQSPFARCTMEPAQVLEQRGMEKTIPPIQRIALSPDGTLWTQLATTSGEPGIIRIHGRESVDTLIGKAFPIFFLSPSHFVAQEIDSAGAVAAALWEIRYRRN